MFKGVTVIPNTSYDRIKPTLLCCDSFIESPNISVLNGLDFFLTHFNKSAFPREELLKCTNWMIAQEGYLYLFRIEGVFGDQSRSVAYVYSEAGLIQKCPVVNLYSLTQNGCKLWGVCPKGDLEFLADRVY